MHDASQVLGKQSPIQYLSYFGGEKIMQLWG